MSRINRVRANALVECYSDSGNSHYILVRSNSAWHERPMLFVSDVKKDSDGWATSWKTSQSGINWYCYVVGYVYPQPQT